jgi:hypothetical protein
MGEARRSLPQSNLAPWNTDPIADQDFVYPLPEFVLHGAQTFSVNSALQQRGTGQWQQGLEESTLSLLPNLQPQFQSQAQQANDVHFIHLCTDNLTPPTSTVSWSSSPSTTASTISSSPTPGSSRLSTPWSNEEIPRPMVGSDAVRDASDKRRRSLARVYCRVDGCSAVFTRCSNRNGTFSDMTYSIFRQLNSKSQITSVLTTATSHTFAANTLANNHSHGLQTEIAMKCIIALTVCTTINPQSSAFETS